MDGIYFLANDIVADWVIVATESIRAKGCTLPICIIPFDDRLQRLEHLASKYRFQIWRDAARLEQLTALGAQFYPHDAVSRHLFRRFACFDGPFARFIFSDVDLVALMNWDEILSAYATDGAPLWYFSLSPQGVYKPGAWLDALRRQGRGVEVNSGLFVSSRGVLSQTVLDSVLPQALAHREQLVETTAEQPFFNFCFDYAEIPMQSADRFLPDLYDWNWAASEFHGRTDFLKLRTAPVVLRANVFRACIGRDMSPIRTCRSPRCI